MEFSTNNLPSYQPARSAPTRLERVTHQAGAGPKQVS
jgi:hypothetical protein